MKEEPTLEDMAVAFFELDPDDEHHQGRQFLLLQEMWRRFGFAEANLAIRAMIQTRTILGLTNETTHF